jgi:glycosyltransferase involved in cell wall biosynthesis
MKKIKVAIVHDYLIDFGGAEEVLAVLHEMYPTAPIYVSILNKKKMGHFWSKFSDAKIVVSWFNCIPFAYRLISPLRFLVPLIWSSFDFSEYDLVISSASWAVTKGLRKGNKTVEICYLHTPPRYLYGYDTSRIWQDKWYGVFVNIYASIVNHFMRIYDFKQAQKVDLFIANSKNVGLRIEKYYKRIDYKVIYPPINIEDIYKDKTTVDDNEFYLTGGRMVAAKNFELIIKAFNKNKKKLKIFGGGIDEKRLKGIANTNITFLGRVSDEKKFELLRSCKAFILAQKDEDSGMTAVEVQAGGKPAIAFRGGGYVEVIQENKTGVFFDELSVECLNNTISKFEKQSFKKDDCVNQARKFSKERFKKEMLQFINEKIKEK